MKDGADDPRPTKKQIDTLRKCHIGVGMLIMKTGENTVMDVEVYQSRKTGELCYIATGKKIQVELEEEETI